MQAMSSAGHPARAWGDWVAVPCLICPSSLVLCHRAIIPSRPSRQPGICSKPASWLTLTLFPPLHPRPLPSGPSTPPALTPVSPLCLPSRTSNTHPPHPLPIPVFPLWVNTGLLPPATPCAACFGAEGREMATSDGSGVSPRRHDRMAFRKHVVRASRGEGTLGCWGSRGAMSRSLWEQTRQAPAARRRTMGPFTPKPSQTVSKMMLASV